MIYPIPYKLLGAVVAFLLVFVGCFLYDVLGSRGVDWLMNAVFGLFGAALTFLALGR